MKKNIIPIAMRCNQEQFDKIKPKLEKERIKPCHMNSFLEMHYLVNNLSGIHGVVSNLKHCAKDYNREIHETWNEKVFLEACGIDATPTLEEVKEYFKDAETVQDLYGVKGDFKNVDDRGIHIWSNCFWICPEDVVDNCCLWDKEKGFAKILTYKQKNEFVITKKQIDIIKEISENTNSLELLDYVVKWFPEAFKEEKKELLVGKWYKRPHNKALFCVCEETKKEPFSIYGFNNGGLWMEGEAKTFSDDEVEATEQEVSEALKAEAVKRGFGKKGVHFKDVNGKIDISTIDGFDFWNMEKCKNENKFNISVCTKKGVIYRRGEWAEIIPTITKEEAEKELGKKNV